MSVLHTYEWGRHGAPALVCLHGVTSHGLRFRRLAEERLAGRFRVVAPDLRGHGRSEWEPPWDLDTHVDDLTETLDALGLERVVVAGHSFGGRLALELAARAPERVERLILLDPAVWVPPPIALQRVELLRQDESFATPEAAIEARIAGGSAPLTPRRFLEEDIPGQLMLGEDGRYRFRYAWPAAVAAYGEMAKAPPLERIRAPALIVRGVDSDVVPPVLAELCSRELSSCAVVTVPGRHVVVWDAFEQTADAILAFLEQGSELVAD